MSPKIGQKLKNNTKDKRIEIRMDEETVEKLDCLVAEQNSDRSKIIRKCIEIQYEKKEKIRWNNLSDEAKSIIEWIENPFTGEKEIVEIKIGKVFQRKCPKCMNNSKQPDVNILITEELYQEVLEFVIYSGELPQTIKVCGFC